jgi:hypothetical protein
MSGKTPAGVQGGLVAAAALAMAAIAASPRPPVDTAHRVHCCVRVAVRQPALEPVRVRR